MNPFKIKGMNNEERVLNVDFLPNHRCFGCGLDNPKGLHMENNLHGAWK